MRESSATPLIVLAAAFYGLYPSFTRLAYEAQASQSYVIVLSTFIRAVSLGGVACIVQRRSITQIFPVSKPLLGAGFLQAVSIIGIIGSLAYIPGPVMITIVFSHTFILLLFSCWKGVEKMTPAVLASTVCALVGISLVVDIFNTASSAQTFGVILAFIGAFATAGRFYLFGQLSRSVPSIIVGSSAMFFATLFLLPLLLVQPPLLPESIGGHLAALGCAITLSIASILTFYSLAVVSAFRVSFLLKIEPVFTSVYAVLLVGDVLSPTRYLGIALVLVSLLGYEVARLRKETPFHSPPIGQKSESNESE